MLSKHDLGLVHDPDQFHFHIEAMLVGNGEVMFCLACLLAGRRFKQSLFKSALKNIQMEVMVPFLCSHTEVAAQRTKHPLQV